MQVFSRLSPWPRSMSSLQFPRHQFQFGIETGAFMGKGAHLNVGVEHISIHGCVIRLRALRGNFECRAAGVSGMSIAALSDMLEADGSTRQQALAQTAELLQSLGVARDRGGHRPWPARDLVEVAHDQRAGGP